MEPRERVHRQEVFNLLRKFEKKLLRIPNIDKLWANFNHHLVSDQPDEVMVVDDQTQAFLDAYQFSNKFDTLTLNSSKIVTGLLDV